MSKKNKKSKQEKIINKFWKYAAKHFPEIYDEVYISDHDLWYNFLFDCVDLCKEERKEIYEEVFVVLYESKKCLDSQT